MRFVRSLILVAAALGCAPAAEDPLVGWLRGRERFQREVTVAEGGGEPTHLVRRSDGRPAIDLGRAASCALCHNHPLGDAGGGPAIRRAGVGRSTPHLYGAGAREQLAQAISVALVAQVDRDGDGVVSRTEAVGTATVNGVDFGSWDDGDGDGRPDLDPAVLLMPIDAAGKRLATASLRDQRIAAWRVAVPAFGWGEPPGRPGIDGSALRPFIAGAFAQHAGLQADDPVGSVSPLGARLLGAAAIDPGCRRDAEGRSLDDPDGDGVISELRSADLTVMERYLLDHPEPPPVAETSGKRHFAAIGCAVCHVESWSFRGVPDRRSLAWTWSAAGATAAARPPGDCSVQGIYSDFRSHDLGPDLHLRHDDGMVITRVRTPPLWGVVSTGPWLHDGSADTLDEAIRRHGGAAAASSAAYIALDEAQRGELLAFLGSLRLRPVGPVR